MGTVSVVSVIGGLWLVPDHGHGESLLGGLAVGDCANVPDHSHEESLLSGLAVGDCVIVPDHGHNAAGLEDPVGGCVLFPTD
jgi:hypothetical protein